MLSTIAFEIPKNFATQLAAGEIVRYGGILKEVGTGKIIGHLQETGLAQSLLASIGSGLPGPLSLITETVNAASNAYTAVKVRQISAMVATLQTMQVATLGISLMGLGVSVAGFAYMHKRLNILDDRMGQIEKLVLAGFEEQRKTLLRQQISRTRGLVQRAQQAHALSHPNAEYAEIASALTDQAAFFEGELDFFIDGGKPINADIFWQLTQLLMLCNTTSIDCRLRSNELHRAFVASESVADSYQTLFNQLTPISFDRDATQNWGLVRVLRDISDSAASKPYLIDDLRTRRISGESFLHALEKEKDNSLVIFNPG